MAVGESGQALIADLVKPGIQVAFWLADGSTARLRVLHDGKRPLQDDIATTLRAAQMEARLIQVDSIDIQGSGSQPASGTKLFIVPAHVVGVVITEELSPNALD